MKLLLDEHFSPVIAEQLQIRGYDVISVAERRRAEEAPLRRTPDEALLRLACNEGRVLVTENVRDFMRIHQTFLAWGNSHAGIIFTSSHTFPRRGDKVGLLIAALAAFLNEHQGSSLADDVAWL